MVWDIRFVEAATLGAAGGCLNGLLTRDRRFLWSWVRTCGPARRQLAQLGFVLNMALGSAGALALLGAGTAQIGWERGSSWLAALALGFAIAHLASSELEKRLLAAAVVKACAAPAAHPDTVLRLDRALPHEAFVMADELMPRMTPRG